MKIIKKESLVSLLLLSVFMFLGSVGFVAAAINLPNTNLPTTDPVNLLKNILNWISTIVAIISVLVIVIAGVMWATAGANEEQQGKARKLLISGVVGLLIVGVAWGLVNVVIGLFT